MTSFRPTFLRLSLLLAAFVAMVAARAASADPVCAPALTVAITKDGHSVTSVKPGETYQISIHATSGPNNPSFVTVRSFAGNPAALVPNSFSLLPNSYNDSGAYRWDLSGPDISLSYSFSVPSANVFCDAAGSDYLSDCPYQVNAWANVYFACLGTHLNEPRNLTISSYLSSYAESGGFTAKVGTTYTVPVYVAASRELPLTKVQPLGPLQIIVLEGDPGLAECSTPNPATVDLLGGANTGFATFQYSCKAKKKGKIRLVFPGAAGKDGGNQIVSTESALQSGIISIQNSMKVNLEFDKTSIPANSSDASTAMGTVSVKDEQGVAIVGQQVNMDGPVWRISPSGPHPRVFVCDDSGRRVYPSAENQWPRSFSRYSDGSGQFKFTVYAGTDTGPAGGSQPGLGLGNLFFDAALPEGDIVNPEDGHKSLTLDLAGEPQTTLGNTRDDLPHLAQNGQIKIPGFGMISAALAHATLPQIQRGLLGFLLELRAAGSITADFGPIVSANGSAGVVYYPRNNPGPIVDYLSGVSPSLPAGYPTLVIPLNHLPATVLFAPKFDDLMVALPAWESGIPPYLSSDDPGFNKPRGKAVPGIAGAGDLGYSYFGYRYPPATKEAEALIGKSRCLNPAPSQMYLSVHSPVRVLVTDGSGNRTGVTAEGDVLAEIPESVVVTPESGAGEVRFSLPVTDLTASLTGTGSGAAVLVAMTPGAEGSDLRVYSFKAKKGSTGVFNITPAGAADAFAFGGKNVKAAKTFTLHVTGLPASLSAPKSSKLKITVKDHFGKALAGAVVSVAGGKFKTSVITNARGKAVLSLKKAGTVKKVTFTVTADSYTAFKKKLKVT